MRVESVVVSVQVLVDAPPVSSVGTPCAGCTCPENVARYSVLKLRRLAAVKVITVPSRDQANVPGTVEGPLSPKADWVAPGFMGILNCTTTGMSRGTPLAPLPGCTLRMAGLTVLKLTLAPCKRVTPAASG